MEAAAQVAGMAVGVALAVKFHSATALVLANVVAALALLLAAAFATRTELNLKFSKAAAGRLLSFSTQVSAQNLIYYSIYTAPAWFVSRLFGSATLGFYSRANVIVCLPANHLSVGLTKSLYPLYARIRGETSEIRAVVEYVLAGTSRFLWPFFAAAAGAAPLIVRVLLGPSWAPTANLLPPLALFAAVNVSFVVAGNPLEALGHLRSVWRLQATWVIATVLVIAFGWAIHMSVVRILFSLAAAQVVVHALQLRLAAARGLIVLPGILRAYAFSVCIAGVFFLIPVGVLQFLSDVDSRLQLLLIGTMLAILTGFVFRFARGFPMTRPVVVADHTPGQRLRVDEAVPPVLAGDV
jgi:PST family polysaccharide transporter